MPRRHMYNSLVGLALGDAFGQQFFVDRDQVTAWVRSRELPPGDWYYTDDTAQAVVLVDHLESYGRVKPDAFATALADEYVRQPMRGYGGTAHQILRAISEGEHWRPVSEAVFSGSGSMGNGAAMRVGPLGALFACDLECAVEQARVSALPTHAHAEAQAGAIAVAVAAALAVTSELSGPEFLSSVASEVPGSATRTGLERASALLPNASVALAIFSLGNGSDLLTQRTVPFALWVASRNMDDFESAMWETVSGLGDRDTNCAIVGSVVGARVGLQGMPLPWAERVLDFPGRWLEPG